jgi:hypothetical protein
MIERRRQMTAEMRRVRREIQETHMTRIRVKLYSLALMSITVGCTGPMGTLRPGPLMTASEAATFTVIPPATVFDGSYTNTLRIVRSFGGGKDVQEWCTSPGQPIITVENGQFTYAVSHPNVPGNATPIYPAIMAADGSFYGAITAGVVSGRVSGKQIEGKIDGSACVYTFSGNRI